MLTLEWIGKNKVVNHHQKVPFRVLERQYSFDEQGQHTENNGSENMIIHGDNLEALKALLPQYEGKVKCMQNIKIQTMIEPFGELITLLLPVQPPIRAWSTPSNIHSQEKCSIPVMVPAGGISRIPCLKS